MAQHDYDIANGSGSAVRADINALADAIASINSGTAAPSPTFGGMFWLDTTNHVFKVRNEANSAWATFLNPDGTLPANTVGNSQIRQGAALSVVGVTGNATANVADIAAGTDGFVLRRSGTALAFGTLAIGAFAANIITNAKLAQMANNTIKGRITAGTGDPEDLSAANVKTILALTKSDVGLANVDNTSDATVAAATQTLTNKTLTAPLLSASPATSDNTHLIPDTLWVNTAIAGAIASGVADGDKGDVVVSSSGTVWTIDSAVVTNAKLATMANSTMKGRLTAGTGAPEDLSVANVKTLLAYTVSDVSGAIDMGAAIAAALVFG